MALISMSRTCRLTMFSKNGWRAKINYSVLIFEEFATSSCAWTGGREPHVCLTLELTSIAVAQSLGPSDKGQSNIKLIFYFSNAGQISQCQMQSLKLSDRGQILVRLPYCLLKIDAFCLTLTYPYHPLILTTHPCSDEILFEQVPRRIG